MAMQVTIGDTTFHIGDTIDVHYKLIEKEKVAGKAKREVKEEVRERTQIFEGTVIAIRGEGDNKSFTVRRIATRAVGVERIFPVISPWIRKITVKEKGKVRRAKLYYLRGKPGLEVEMIKQKRTPTKPTKKSAKSANFRTKKSTSKTSKNEKKEK